MITVDQQHWNNIKNNRLELDAQISAWINKLIWEYEEERIVFLEPVKNTTIRKMLTKLNERQNWGYFPRYKFDYLPADKVVNFDISKDISSITHNGLDDLRYEAQRYESSSGADWRYQQFKHSMEDLFLRIWYGKEKIFHLKTHASGLKTGVYKVLEDWYDKVYNDKLTLLSCLPPQPQGSWWHPF